MDSAVPASSIQNLDRQRRRRLAAVEGELLRKILSAHGEILKAGLDPFRVVEVVAARAQELTQSDGAVVEIVDGEHLVHWAVSGCLKGLSGLRVSTNGSLSGLSARTGSVLRCEDSETDPRVDLDLCRRMGVRSMLVAPLPYDGAVIGVLKVVSSQVSAFAADDVRTLELLNELIGASLAHAVHHASLEADLNSRIAADRLVREEDAAGRERILAIIRDESFDFVFQPIVDLRSGHPHAFEALVRFSGPPYRPPGYWLGGAAKAGLALELELALVRKALRSLARVPAQIALAINVSPPTAMSDELEALCLAADPARIVLEITEHSRVDEYGPLHERIRELRRVGIRFAIDDAGAGFSSLRHVLRLEPDLIKLDDSITRNLDSLPGNQNLFSAMLTFARGTSAALIAEGVETEAELDTLKRIGIPLAQGHCLGRPGPLPTAEGRIAGKTDDSATTWRRSPLMRR